MQRGSLGATQDPQDRTVLSVWHQNLSPWHLLSICSTEHKTLPVGQTVGAGSFLPPLSQALPLNLCHFVQMQLERIKMSARHNCLH